MSAPTSSRTAPAPREAAKAESLTTREDVLAVCARAREASRAVRPLTRGDKDRLLLAMADAVVAGSAEVERANAEDLRVGAESGLSQGLLDRLRLDATRVGAVADALRDLAALPDPVGEVVRGQRLANGLEGRQTRAPMGGVGMVYEARRNVTVDAAGLALKSGNAVVLRGGSAAERTNRALVDVLRRTLEAHGLPADAVVLLDGGGREAVRHLMTARGLVDVLIPRGGADLIRSVVEGSTVPVIETGVGNCHVYVDAAADLDKAVNILVDAKARRPSVCNAAETFLVHADVADRFLPMALRALADAGVTVHGDQRVAAAAAAAGTAFAPVTEDDWLAEYYSL